MSDVFILDACALIALLAGESGGENVKKIIQDAVDGNANVKMNQMSLRAASCSVSLALH